MSAPCCLTLLLQFSALLSGLVDSVDIHHSNGAQKRPNFIIILADDMGWGDLGINQPEKKSIHTPWLDLLAREGKRFTDFHAPASMCTPSRAGLLTGRLGLRTGVINNFDVGAIGGLPLNETTFAQHLHDAGYYTAMIGKWHLGHNRHYNPIHRGFDYYLGLPYSTDMGCTDHPGFTVENCQACSRLMRHKRSSAACYTDVALPLIENQTITEQPVDLWSLAKRYTGAAVKILHNARERGQPFLLYMALAHMHVPLTPGQHPNATADDAYAATLREMDDLVGVLKTTSDSIDKENTLIWFTSDNGPWGKECQFAGSVGPFLGRWQRKPGSTAKLTTWEGGHRVPALTYWPGKIPVNTTSSALLSGLDIFPTLLSLAGVKRPSDRRYDGIDMTDILLHGSETGHKSLFHPNSGAAGQYGQVETVRMGDYKVFYTTSAATACGGGGERHEVHNPPLIFDLSRDPAEGQPLEPESEAYQAVLQAVQQERKALLWDIATDNVSVADFTTEKDASPCCQPQNPACRCQMRIFV